jgi:tRNA(Ile)-lysidine synthase
VAATQAARYVVTAHHADDRAETVLQRLLRGAGPRGLAVLRPCSEDLLRPMIRARRADVLAHLERHGIAFARDPSNVDARFLRTRIRHEVLPLLETLSPEVVTHLVALADQLGELGAESDAPAAARDEAGALIALNREQAAQLRQARARGTNGDTARLRVPLSGARELVLDRDTGAAVVRGRSPGAVRRGERDPREPSD